MTIMSNPPAVEDTLPVELITVTIDGIDMQVPKGTLIIRAAEQLGIQIPRFCDHPDLEPVAMCRACLVEIEGQAKPQPSCAIACADGMKVRTQYSSEMAEEAQRGVMEFVLANHPLDCPVCDKGGECPLQNQAMQVGRPESRFDLPKNTFEKPINVSAQILLDRERCVNCARCTRFADQIAGDPFIALLERGANQQVGTSDDQPFDSYFSGNTIQICPVGALTSAKYRFKSRPFDLVSVPTSCEHCSAGCSLRTDVRRGVVQRRLAWDDPQVNNEWNCDKGRFAFTYTDTGRITNPLVRDADGVLRPASWPAAIAAAAEGLRAASRKAVITGGRHTVEDAWAYSKFARGVLGTDDLDFRARPHSAEEAAFLSAVVAGTGVGVTYRDLEKASYVLLVGFEPEDESPIVHLRLRKAVRNRTLSVAAIAPYASLGLTKLNAHLIATAAGDEARVLAALGTEITEKLSNNAVILVGERLASVPGAFSAAKQLADRTGARLAWVPRRAGDRAAVEAGLLPGLLPGGRPLADAAARAEIASAWNVPSANLPAATGRDLDAILANARDYDAVVVGAFDPNDAVNPAQARAALEQIPFVVSLEQRVSDVTELADVVLPVAPVVEKAGTFIDWEGRARSFQQAIKNANSMSDARVLSMIADAMDVFMGVQNVNDVRAEITALGAWTGPRVAAPTVAPTTAQGVTLATWNQLLDAGSLQDGEPYLAATARPVVAYVSQNTANGIGVNTGEVVKVSTSAGSVEAPVVITVMADNTVWLPTNNDGSQVRQSLHAAHGATVTLSRGGAA